MRAFASYLAGALVLIMLMAAGGAWTPTPASRMVPLRLDPATTFPAFDQDLPGPAAPEPPEIGCLPPQVGASCPTPRPVPPPPPGPDDLIPQSPLHIEDWRPLVSLFFEDDDVGRALDVIACESGGNPLAKNPRSTASGLFQHLASLWEERSLRAGWEGADVFDPVANVAVAAWLTYEFGGWSHWNQTRGCWE